MRLKTTGAQTDRTGMASGSSTDRAPDTPEPAEPASEEESLRQAGIDPDSYRYWKAAVARLPPMTYDEIHAVARILNRIDQRRKLPTHHNQNPE
jgi:hypothetical protein